MKIRSAIICLITLLGSVVCRADDGLDSKFLRLYYPVGYRAVDLSYENSARALNVLTRDLRAISASGSQPWVEMVCFTSPDADNDIAHNIARGRAEELGVLLASRNIIADTAVRLIYRGVGWDELAHMVETSPMAHSGRVLKILRMPDREIAMTLGEEYSALIIERLKRVAHGEAYRHIQSHFYPVIRNLLSVTYGSDTANVLYRIGYNEAVLDYADNREQLGSLIEAIKSNPGKRVTVSCMLEPAGDNQVNRYVAENRFEKLRNYLVEQTGIAPESVMLSYNGDGWEEIARLLRKSDLPWRTETLRVIGGAGLPPVGLREVATQARIKALKAIDGGRTYHLLATRFFPTLRNTTLLRAVAVTTGEEIAPKQLVDEPSDSLLSIDEPKAVEAVYERVPGRWSVKTNLLYDALLAPTVEAEYQFSPNWSLGLEYTMAWWKNTSDGRTYQLAVISPEARYHIAPRANGSGHYVGVFPGFTWYDLSNKSTGHRGEGYFAGVSYGYIWHIKRNLLLETGLGVGYLSTRYKDYTPHEGHHVYRSTRTTGYFGPLKARVALVWRFDSKPNK